MERYGYPRLADHDAAHKYLLAEVNNFSNEIFKGGDQFMFSLLEGWLLEHILSEDIALGHFLQEQKGACLAERHFPEHLNEFVKVLVSVVKPEFAFFQMKVKSMFCQPSKAHKARLSEGPEAFNAINM